VNRSRPAQLVVVVVLLLAAGWGLLRLRPRVLELQAARAQAELLASGPGATREMVAGLERELAREQEAGRASAATLTGSDLSRLAAEAGLAVDVSNLWVAPAAGRALAPGAAAPLAERLHTQDPGRLIIRWSARGEFSSLLRFVDALGRAGHAAVLELGLSRAQGGQGPLHIDLVLTP
jgi:hypothetical protein